MTNGPVRLRQLRHEQHADHTRLSALVDGEEIVFTVGSALPVRYPVLAFLPALLQEAMARGEDVIIEDDAKLPAGLRDNLARYQCILTNWNDEDLRTVAIVGGSDVNEAPAAATLCCFSGGIDSQYSYFRHRDEVSHLLVIQGFDQDSSTEEWQRNVAARRAFAEPENRELVPVASNLRRFFEQRKLSWTLAHGSVLAAIGSMFGAQRLFIPSSFTYSDLFPWGSHPLLDTCWSSQVSEIVHDGLESTRSGKTVWLSTFQHGLDHLQVCWRGTDSNCGNCPKCVRTSLVLHLLGKQSACLPPYTSSDQLNWLKPGTPSSLAFVEDLISFCRQHDASHISNRLRAYRRRFLLKYHLAELAKAMFGSSARKLSHRLWPEPWQRYRVRIRSARDYL